MDFKSFPELNGVIELPHTKLTETAKAVKNAEFPKVPAAYMSAAEVEANYRPYTDYRINQIVSDVTVPEIKGTAYYFSSFRGNDNNNGLTADKPLKTLFAVNKLPLKSGDAVLLERGSFFRGGIIAPVSGITISAFGEGPKPVICGSQVDAAKVGEWYETDEPNVYVYSYKIPRDVGAIYFNNGELHSTKCIPLYEDDGSVYDITTGRPFTKDTDLHDDLHFYHEHDGNNLIYLRCEKGNPKEVFNNIELATMMSGVGAQFGVGDLLVNNITFKYAGAHAVSTSTIKNLTVQNCEFYFIGGSIQSGPGMFGRKYATRFGNAIQIYGGCDGFYVRNNYIYEVYDAAITFQYNVPDGQIAKCVNADVADNVVEYTNYSFEYFLSGGIKEECYIENVGIHNNLMWYAGKGLCEERPDKTDDAHVKGWYHDNPCRGNFTFTDNLFAYGKSQLIQANAEIEEENPVFNNNTYIQNLGGPLGRCRKVWKTIPFNEDAKQKIFELFADENPTVIFVK